MSEGKTPTVYILFSRPIGVISCGDLEAMQANPPVIP